VVFVVNSFSEVFSGLLTAKVRYRIILVANKITGIADIDTRIAGSAI